MSKYKICKSEITYTEEYVDKLTNNWNELEEYLNEQIQRSWEIEEQCYETILDKMNEIKGDKE